MLTNEKINEFLGITESYQAPRTLLSILMDEAKKNCLFEQFLQEEPNLSYEWFHDYFEAEHADRKKKKQDFTPDSVSELCAKIIGPSDEYFEAAAGTGGMMIQAWNVNPNRFFTVEELSDRSIPFLIFNLSIRNINGVVRHGDSLKQDFKNTYVLNSGEKFSQIII